MGHLGVLKVAQAMVWVFQASAIIEVRQRATEALDSGDETAFRAWCAIQRAVRSIQSYRTER
jgi:hypothetical protein